MSQASRRSCCRHFSPGWFGVFAASVACAGRTTLELGDGVAGDGDAAIADGSGDTATDTGAAVVSLDLAPQNAVIFIDTATVPPTPATQTFTARSRFADGTSVDATGAASFAVEDPSLGTFSGPSVLSVAPLPVGSTLLSAVATTHISARAYATSASANLAIAQLRRTGEARDFYFVVPHLAPSSTPDVLVFSTAVKQVDLAFSLDTTASMGPVIATMKSALADVIAKLGATVPSVAVSLSGQDDFPYDGHGTPPDLPFYLLQSMTTDIGAAKAALTSYTLHSGADHAEAQYEAMYQILTGTGVNWPSGSIPKHVNAPGTSGGVDFRPGALHLVVLITDANFHQKADYRVGAAAPPLPHGVEDVKVAYANAGARHIGVAVNWDDASGGTGPYAQDLDLAQASGAFVPADAFKGACGTGKCCTGVGGAGELPNAADGKSCLLVYKASLTGSSVPDSVVSAVRALAAGKTYDVTAVASNDPANPGGIDATKFIAELRAMDEGDAGRGCLAHTATDTDGSGVKDTFIGVTPGTPICFEVIPRTNDAVPANDRMQFFQAFIDLLGAPGGVRLDRRTVLFYVPPTTG